MDNAPSRDTDAERTNEWNGIAVVGLDDKYAYAYAGTSAEGISDQDIVSSVEWEPTTVPLLEAFEGLLRAATEPTG